MNEPRPSGPALWTALILHTIGVAMLCAWIWTGQWRWGLTAVFHLLTGLVAVGYSIKDDRGQP